MPDPLSARLKQLIVETLHLEDVEPDSIPDNEPLVGGGLSLDSIDALELVVRLEKEFGLKISSSEEARVALASVASLTRFVRERGDPSKISA